jgi:tetratricopeptide (TPR) repeat protein
MSKHEFSSFSRLAVVILLSLNCCAPVFASALLEEGKQAFSEKRYNAAAKTFDQVVSKENGNPEAYYWLGRALEELKDREGAKTMYMAAFKLNPFGPQASTAKKALLDLSARQAQLDHPTDGPEIMAKTLQQIERQAQGLKVIKIDDANRFAQQRIYDANQRSYNMGYQANMGIQNVPGGTAPGFYAPLQSISSIRNQVHSQGGGNPYLNVGNPYANRTYDNWAGYPGGNPAATTYGGGYGGGGYGGYGYGGAGYGATGTGGGFGYAGGGGGAVGYTPYAGINMYGRHAVSNARQINTSYLRSDANVQAMRAQQEGVKAAAELQKSANNLESLLSEKEKAGSPHLRALGTNLFVRNYSDHDDDSVPPVDPVIELKAKQQTLADVEKGAQAKAQKLVP